MKKLKLVIVGAGPKALNILAKAQALKNNGWDVPEIIVLEKNEIGANWSGNYGYTDGKGVLGISPLKVFNYPSKSIFGEAVISDMDKYSFIKYLTHTEGLEKWVDGGMGWILHKEFSDYLKWIGGFFPKNICFGEVVKVNTKNKQWIVTYKNKNNTKEIVCDGLVFTGPGEISNPFPIKPDGIRVFDAKNWWKDKKDINFYGKLALIGGGISAGSIFESISKDMLTLDWYSRRGLFTRSENFANNQRFSVPDLWQQVPFSVRKSFISATDRGSLDSTTHNYMVASSHSFKEIICEINKVEIIDKKIKISFKDGLNYKERIYDQIILCTGFDNMGFLNLFAENIKKELKENIEEKIEPDLSVLGLIPKLYLPMLSYLNVGIGCATLGSPSIMSDRVLSSLVSKKSNCEKNKNVKVFKGSLKGDYLIAQKTFSAGEILVNGYATKISTQRTTTSVQIGIDLHMEPSFFFVKANHSCNPNCGIKLNNSGGYSLVAMKEIKKGEEITWDYAMSEWESIALENTNCKCGSSICRGAVGGYKDLSLKIKQKYIGFTAPYLKYLE
ncbi:MAG: SidA/IucD/PvdA family monooxygenase [Candidatus Pacebacteria bacterium]|nr:SidA/IucD/PvdA family monooxygenase [Candidatus Paceibacterota bacterium]MCF7863000.1 SidA/IucD/PvdA family monooxygenase [Candidatus Paceibacterota bacterium]